MAQTFYRDGNLSSAAPCGQARISFPFEGDSHAPVNQIAWLVNGTNPTGLKYQLFPPDPNQTNSNESAFILEQDFQQSKDSFSPLPIGTPYDNLTFWPDYAGTLNLLDLVLISESPTTDLTGAQVQWTRTYATIPPPRNTYENFAFTFPGVQPSKLGIQTNTDLANVPGLGNLFSSGGPIQTEVLARVEHIYFQLIPGSYSPNYVDPSQADYIIPTFRVFFNEFYNEQSYLFNSDRQNNTDWINVADGTTTTAPSKNTIPPASDAVGNDADSGLPYIGGLLHVAEICVKQSVIRPWRGNIYEKITLFALAQ